MVMATIQQLVQRLHLPIHTFRTRHKPAYVFRHIPVSDPHTTHRSFTQTFNREAAQNLPGAAAITFTPLRILSFLAVAFFFTSGGFLMASIPAIEAANGILYPPTDEETLTMYTAEDDISKKIDEFIDSHPIAIELRRRPEFSESRPHLKMPESQRGHNLTGGTLMGPGRVVVPPRVWTEHGGKSLVSISYLGDDLCGHPGLIHGGFLATMLDEGLARCCFGALPNKIGMTANLNINYRSPAPAGAFVVLRARTTRVEGRKAWVEGHIETLVGAGDVPLVLVEASALFIEPRSAATLARVYPVS